MGDGLDELDGRRRQRRAPLPPRHPRPPGGPADDSTASAEQDQVGERGVAAVPSDPPEPDREPLTAEVRQPPRRRAARTQGAAMPLRLVQVYLTPEIDAFLRQARSMAIVQNLDVTASAVVRHAMEQLMATAGAAELVTMLGRPKGQGQQHRGRPRR